MQTAYSMTEQPAAGEYKGCGRAWVAIEQDEIVGVRYMGDHSGALTRYSAEAIAMAGRVRPCPASEQAAHNYNDAQFVAWRTQARRELEELGTVISGTMSCTVFIPRGVDPEHSPDPEHDVIGSGEWSHYEIAEQLEMRGYIVDADTEDNEHSWVRHLLTGDEILADIYGDSVATVKNC